MDYKLYYDFIENIDKPSICNNNVLVCYTQCVWNIRKNTLTQGKPTSLQPYRYKQFNYCK